MIKLGKQFWRDILKTVLISLIFSSVFILALSLLIGFVPIGEKWIVAINQVIKLLSLLFSCLFCFKEKSKGAIKGIIVGLLYGVIGWLLFGTVQDSFTFTVSTLIDIALSGALGLLSGIFAVIFGKKSIA